MSVEEKAANEKAKYEIFSYYVHAGWQTGRDEQGFEVHIYENCSPNTFSSIATVSTDVCGILSVMAVSRNAVC